VSGDDSVVAHEVIRCAEENVESATNCVSQLADVPNKKISLLDEKNSGSGYTLVQSKKNKKKAMIRSNTFGTSIDKYTAVIVPGTKKIGFELIRSKQSCSN
jgi:hypothetical protein